MSLYSQNRHDNVSAIGEKFVFSSFLDPVNEADTQKELDDIEAYLEADSITVEDVQHMVDRLGECDMLYEATGMESYLDEAYDIIATLDSINESDIKKIEKLANKTDKYALKNNDAKAKGNIEKLDKYQYKVDQALAKANYLKEKMQNKNYNKLNKYDNKIDKRMKKDPKFEGSKKELKMNKKYEDMEDKYDRKDNIANDYIEKINKNRNSIHGIAKEDVQYMVERLDECDMLYEATGMESYLNEANDIIDTLNEMKISPEDMAEIRKELGRDPSKKELKGYKKISRIANKAEKFYDKMDYTDNPKKLDRYEKKAGKLAQKGIKVANKYGIDMNYDESVEYMFDRIDECDMLYEATGMESYLDEAYDIMDVLDSITEDKSDIRRQVYSKLATDSLTGGDKEDSYEYKLEKSTRGSYAPLYGQNAEAKRAADNLNNKNTLTNKEFLDKRNAERNKKQKEAGVSGNSNDRRRARRLEALNDEPKDKKTLRAERREERRASRAERRDERKALRAEKKALKDEYKRRKKELAKEAVEEWYLENGYEIDDYEEGRIDMFVEQYFDLD